MPSLPVCSLIVFFCLLPALVFSDSGQDCIGGRHHKDSPGPEDLSGTHCSKWSAQSCCNRTTAMDLTKNSSDGTWLNFRWDHCKPLSPQCRKHFVLDLCFYECSPNTAPWIIPDPRKKIRRDRFANVPLCQSDCDDWFEDCKDDLTCTDNWNKNFVWDQGVNKCPEGSSCRTFKEVFGTSKVFCESIFDHSFKYVSDSQPCMKLNFTGVNPNDKVETWQRGWEKRPGYQSPNHGRLSVVPALFIVMIPVVISWIGFL